MNTAELYDNYINGNISDAKKALKKGGAVFALGVALYILELSGAEELKRFLTIMTR